MNPKELLRQAWTRAGYPTPAGPLVAQLDQVAAAVYAAYQRGESDFIASGWRESGVDFPFAPAHPRYQAMLTAYRDLARAH
jgi:hypothetical protein